jgi:hypothetical protein
MNRSQPEKELQRKYNEAMLARLDALIKRVELFENLDAHYHLCAKRWGMSFCNCPLRKLQ